MTLVRYFTPRGWIVIAVAVMAIAIVLKIA